VSRGRRGGAHLDAPLTPCTEARRDVGYAPRVPTGNERSLSRDASSSVRVIGREALDELFGALTRRGYTLIGPTVRQRAVVYDEIESAADLPAGVVDDQDGGTYRIAERPGEVGLFGHNVGPNSWKERLFVPRLRLWRARRSDDGEVTFDEEQAETPRQAFIGVRSCDLHAILVQDRTFVEGTYVDPDYEARRNNCFIVAVNCAQAAKTCFCVSMDTGPRATTGFDLVLTELLDDGGHRFLAEVGTDAGAEVLAEVTTRASEPADERRAEAAVERAAQQQVRHLDTTDIRDLLYRNLEHPRWDDVADRCLSCGNCTMVCPTCFCSTVEDVTDLTGDGAERVRGWDSCFSLEHSYVHGGVVRASVRSRYRQWMTHKLASWIDQFGTSGCIGCGRCITWCPVAIDITEEVAAIRATDGEDAHADNR
jgi:sulfhydrogenase subunit beta (sulfur reductase)